MESLIGQEFITAGGNLFIITEEKGRLLTAEILTGPNTGSLVDIPKGRFSILVDTGIYSEVEGI